MSASYPAHHHVYSDPEDDEDDNEWLQDDDSNTYENLQDIGVLGEGEREANTFFKVKCELILKLLKAKKCQ